MIGPYVAGGLPPELEHQGDDVVDVPAAPSLAAGAIGRSLADSMASAYREQLTRLWDDTLAGAADLGPWDD